MLTLLLLILVPSLGSALPPEFSEFHLLPCCFPPDPFHQLPSENNVVQVSGRTADHIGSFSSIYRDEDELKTSNQQNKSTFIFPLDERKIFRFIVPLKSRVLAPPTLQLPPSDSQESPFDKKSTFIFPTSYLNEAENSSLLLLNNTEQLNKTTTTTKTKRETKGRGGRIRFTRLIKFRDTGTGWKFPSTDEDLSPAESKSEKRYAENGQTNYNGKYRMPTHWLNNLRRALFQSMTSIGNESTESEKKISQPDLSSSTNQELWSKISEAKLTMVDPVKSESSEIPDSLFLPPGQGPVAAGIVINSLNGLRLRMLHDLHLQQRVGEECHCHLIRQGEALVAYWSISRIFNDLNQPALQYLVYPIPHAVPTPPQLFPIRHPNGIIHPSPVDPVPHHLHNNPHLHGGIGPGHPGLGGGHPGLDGGHPGLGGLGHPGHFQDPGPSPLLPIHGSPIPPGPSINPIIHGHGSPPPPPPVIVGEEKHLHVHHHHYPPPNLIPTPLALEDPNGPGIGHFAERYSKLPHPSTTGYGDDRDIRDRDYPHLIEGQNGYNPEFINVYKSALDSHLERNGNFRNDHPPPTPLVLDFFPKSIQEIITPLTPHSRPPPIENFYPPPSISKYEKGDYGQDKDKYPYFKNNGRIEDRRSFYTSDRPYDANQDRNDQSKNYNRDRNDRRFDNDYNNNNNNRDRDRNNYGRDYGRNYGSSSRHFYERTPGNSKNHERTQPQTEPGYILNF